MAVNKNFVVKNGLEVRQDLILADATNTTVGIGTSVPQYTLDVAGGIGVTNIYVAGFSTFIGVSTHTGQSFFNDVQVSGAGTVTGDFTIGGNLDVTGDITYDEVSGRNLYISGLATIGTLGVQTSLTVTGTGVTTPTLNVSGVSTFGGIGTFGSDVYIDGNLNVVGDIVYDEVTGRNLNITGIATIATLYAAAGIITASDVHVSAATTTKDLLVTGISTFEGLSYFGSNVGVGTTNPAIAADSNNTNVLNTGIVTANYLYGDGSGITNVTASSGGVIGLASEGVYIGTGVTTLDLKSSNGTAWTVSEASSGFATATITPGVSIGLAIALGG